jgi:hypothetical protein
MNIVALCKMTMDLVAFILCGHVLAAHVAAPQPRTLDGIVTPCTSIHRWLHASATAESKSGST